MDCLLLLLNCGRYYKIVGMLNNVGRAKLNLTNIDGVTALHYASHFGRHQCARVLLKAGADAEIKTIDGDTALGVALQMGHAKVISQFQKQARRNANEKAKKSNTLSKPLPKGYRRYLFSVQDRSVLLQGLSN